MGLGSLTNRAAGQTILDTFFNDIHSAMNGDFVGRNSSGVATAGQNLGTAALPWGIIRGDTLILNGQAVDDSQIVSPANRVVSGKTRTTSNQPAFITPNGAAASAIIAGSATNLVLSINGVAATVNTDITLSGLTVAPGSNNTCTVNDSAAADQLDTRLWGEPQHRKGITVASMGSNITALVGKFAAFKIGGTSDEYFYAFVESSTQLSKIRRGYYYNSSLAPINRAGFTNSDTITLMSLGWVFVENNGTTANVTYTNPVWSFTAPSSPATGDYWYDLANETWKRYDGATFQIINRTLIGQVVLDSTNCVAARCERFHKNWKSDNTLELEIQSTEIVRAAAYNRSVNVNGTLLSFGKSLPTWNMTTNLAIPADMYDSTEQASRTYYLYVKDDGNVVISDITPYADDGEVHGEYHPHNPWRCVGIAYNNASSNVVGASDEANGWDFEYYFDTANGMGSTNTKIRKYTNATLVRGASGIAENSATLGASVTCEIPGDYWVQIDDHGPNNGLMGVSLNSAQLTTDIGSITQSTRLCTTEATNVSSHAGVIVNLKRGDVVRPHVITGFVATDAHNQFRVKRVTNSKKRSQS